MGKFALLIGVSESSEEDLPALPSAIEDVKAMQAVLQNPNLGGFDSVKILKNPTRQEIEEAIETLFTDCKKEDLALVYFSGHGIIDDKGKLYLVTPQTRKKRGNLMKSTAVSATVLHDSMDNSCSKRQVLILDSCFSGAIADGMTVKSAERKVDIQRELGGEGRAILTSSSAVQKSLHISGYKLSIYTHYLIEGIQTGSANQDGDGYISVEELHNYVKKKLQEEFPQIPMSPQYFPVREGYKIRLVRSPKPKVDPELEYPKNEQDRSDLDLSKPLLLTFKEMNEGSTKDILLGDGQKITIKVPAGVKEGKKLRIEGKGRIDPNTQERGDLYLIIQHDALVTGKPESNSAVESNKFERSCEVFVQRKFQLHGGGNKFDVYCDGSWKKTIFNGEKCSFRVSPGTHEIQIKYNQYHTGRYGGWAWGESEVFTHTLNANENLSLQCYYLPIWKIRSFAELGAYSRIALEMVHLK